MKQKMKKRRVVMNKFIIIVFAGLFTNIYAYSQDKSRFVEYKEGFYENSILKDIRAVDGQKKRENTFRYFSYDFAGKEFPTDTNLYSRVKYNPSVSQGNTGTCWCFAATSFMESEAMRLNHVAVKISEMYTVYWEYIERAKDFVKTRGETYFEQGSEANAIPKIWKEYGIVPKSVYEGKRGEGKFYDHSKLIVELKNYLKGIEESSAWNERKVIEGVQSILDDYMGTPPKKFTYKGKNYTPKTFLKDYLNLRMNDYFSFMSTMSVPFMEMHELVEPDNWWHSRNYYNLSVNDYYELIQKTIKDGYSICICGDVSEAGYSSFDEVGIVPDFDIPSEAINDYSRQFRLSNGTTTDDHCIHLVGIYESDNGTWFMIKDSGSGGFNGKNKGYRFVNEDYIRLKMMNILIHRTPATPILDKIIK